MGSRKARHRRAVRRRVGRVSYYEHHGAWWLYYRDGESQVRRRVADTEPEAERVAAQVNAQLSAGAPTLLAFAPISVAALREQFLTHHEHGLHSSVATIRRYRAATQHLVDFAVQFGRSLAAHDLPVERFLIFLRNRRVSPNGHAHTQTRRLRDKGVRFICQVCRSVYSYAARMRHLPPYVENPFAALQVDRLRVEDAKPIFVFTAETEATFFSAADDWAFPIHFTLGKTGLRPGELVHLLIEDVDLDNGWLRICNKVELGWRIKTGAERTVPLISELQQVLRRVIGSRINGPVFLRPRFMRQGEIAVQLDRSGLASLVHDRLEQARRSVGKELCRSNAQRVLHSVWRDAGAVKTDMIRQSFVRIMKQIGLPHSTCPKSWRHTMATLLQDANVDPLIRQITLGHQPANSSKGSLGMTGVYTHTRPETHRAQLDIALQLWPASLALARRWASTDD